MSIRRLQPLDRVALDSCNLPVLLEGQVDVRKVVTLTAATCCATGAIMGFVVCSNPTSAETLEMCLENAIAPKTNASGSGSAIHPYEMNGMPKTLVVEPNTAGRTFAERNEAQSRFNIEMPRSGHSASFGVLERFFHSVAQDLPNYLKVSGWLPVVDGRYHRYHKGRPITLADLNAIILRYVVDFYHQVPRREGKTIAMAWKEGMALQSQTLQRPMIS
jgi:putative transposase